MQIDRMGDISIIVAGILMHLQRLSPFAANNPTALQQVPNAASTLLSFTLLVALSKWRPIRGPPRINMGLAQGILRLLVELTTITFMVEFFLVWIWVPMLMALTELCEWITEGYLEENLPTLADWFNNRYYAFRFLFAASLATIIFYTRSRLTKNAGQGLEREGEQEGCPYHQTAGNSQAACNCPIAVHHCDRTIQTTKVPRFTIDLVTETESYT